MKIKNIIVINGEEIDMEDLSESDRQKIVNQLNSIALGHLNYYAEDQTA